MTNFHCINFAIVVFMHIVGMSVSGVVIVLVVVARQHFVAVVVASPKVVVASRAALYSSVVARPKVVVATALGIGNVGPRSSCRRLVVRRRWFVARCRNRRRN